jgi:hypothetical protein
MTNGALPYKWSIEQIIFRHRSTFILRVGMLREFIRELRGDVRMDTIAIYEYIGQKELRLRSDKSMQQLE